MFLVITLYFLYFDYIIAVVLLLLNCERVKQIATRISTVLRVLQEIDMRVYYQYFRLLNIIVRVLTIYLYRSSDNPFTRTIPLTT